MKRWVILLALAALPHAAQAQSSPANFGDYPARPFTGKPAPARINTRDTRLFRSRLRWATKNQRPNFAGRLILTGWGCGTSCYSISLIDAKTGRVYFPGFSIHHGGVDGEPLEYRADSRLLVVRGERNEDGRPGTFYYLWNGTRLTLIRSAPL